MERVRLSYHIVFWDETVRKEMGSIRCKHPSRIDSHPTLPHEMKFDEVKLMKKLDFIKEVEIILPNKETVYSIKVKKSELGKCIGTNFESIKSNWNEKFSNPFVNNDNGREKFFSKFGEKK